MRKFGLGFLLLVLLSVRFVSSAAGAAVDPINPWVEDRSLPYKLASHSSLSLDNKLVVVTGSAVTYDTHDDVIFSSPDAFGSLSIWNYLPKYPKKTMWTAAANTASYAYVLGGYEEYSASSHFSDDFVYFSLIGPLMAWTSTTPLPQRLTMGAATVAATASGNYVYFSGGWTDSPWNVLSTSNKVYYAFINNDGSLGAWTATTDLPDILSAHGMVAYGGYVYVIGGWNSGHETTEVWRAQVNSDGTLGSWTAMPSLPGKVRNAGITLAGNYVIVVGGHDNSQLLNTVYYTSIDAAGQMAGWQTSSNSLPFKHCCGSMAEVGGYLYLSGGFVEGPGYTEKVYRSKLNIILPTPTPTPTPTPIVKVVIVPGMGASWNADALLNCKSDGYEGGWSMSSFAAGVYDPLISALSSAGVNVSVFNYDWRREIPDNQPGLRNFIDEAGGRSSLVGHSMGGLLGRAYLESSGSGNKLTDLITVGSPHRGSALAYPAWSAGEIWDNDLLIKIATTLLLKRCGSTNKTDRQVLQTFWSSIHNLLPIDNYLRDRTNGNMKPVDDMVARNNWQPTNFQSYGVHVGTLSGVGVDTLQNIPVKNRSKKDAVLGDWEDGKPAGKEMTSQGDGVVLALNASLPGFENRQINGTHLEIVSSADGVNQILDLLGIAASATQAAWQEPKSALIVIGNNAKLMLFDPKGKVKSDSNGVASVINPVSGKYKYVLIPKKLQSELIVIQVKDHGDVLYNEYKFNNLLPKFGDIDF